MIRVEDVEVSAAYYAKVFGLRPKWSGEGTVGLAFPETDAEIVLHRKTTIPSSVEVHYLVDDVVVAVAHYAAQGCQILVAPFRHHSWEMRPNQRSIWYETLHPRYHEGSSSFQPSRTTELTREPMNPRTRPGERAQAEDRAESTTGILLMATSRRAPDLFGDRFVRFKLSPCNLLGPGLR
jgi:hypothetical protein